MALTLRGDIFIDSSGAGHYADACTDSTSIYTIDSVNKFRIYNISDLHQTNANLTTRANAAGICLGAAATAVIVYTSANVDFVNVNTNQLTNVTSNAAATYTNSATQQVAADPSNQVCIATRNANSSVSKINVTTQVLSALSPSSLSGIQASCVVFKPDTSNFILGTNNGKIIEIDSSGNVINNITMPASPAVATVTTIISGLSYYNNKLAVATDRGFLYILSYPSGTILQTIPVVPGEGSNVSTSLCSSASGLFMAAHKYQPGSTQSVGVNEYSINGTTAITGPVFWNENNARIQSVGIEPTVNKAWLLTGTNLGAMVRVFDITSPQIGSEPTRSQDPPNTDITARVLRIRYDAPGQAFIEVDQNVGSGSVALNTTKGHSYIELSIETGSKFDARTFKA